MLKVLWGLIPDEDSRKSLELQFLLIVFIRKLIKEYFIDSQTLIGSLDELM